MGTQGARKPGAAIADRVAKRVLRDSSTLSVLVGLVTGPAACLVDLWQFGGRQSWMAGVAGFALGVALSSLAMRAFGSMLG